jgi:heptosyltransferase-3
MSKSIDLADKTILISRTDSIGDVVLTLPMCAWIKENFPTSKIIFLGNTYTLPVLKCMPQIDEIITWSDLEKMPSANRLNLLRELKIDICIHVFPHREIASLMRKAKIPVRVGTSHRSFHLLTCNIRPNFTRKNSTFHESQLNFELLKPFGIEVLPELETINRWMRSFRAPETVLPAFLTDALAVPGPKVILHPKSQGSAVEWSIENYVAVATDLLSRGYIVFFTGTEKEGAGIRSAFPQHPQCIDTTGKFTLDELITFISRCEALVACSTGPLHLAGILGLRTVGLFSPRKPIHPGRWKALGQDVRILVYDQKCTVCAKGKPCHCIMQIEPQVVLNELLM